ncbi:3-deoxy-7-phosphoheptulonate synthase [bacterium]|nr:3-deoxy-7-phosphoheptulonate synthase [bacterium]
MIIVMRHGSDQAEISHVVEAIENAGLKVHISQGVERTIIGAIGNEAQISSIPFEAFPGVESATPIVKPYKLAGRELHPKTSAFELAPGVQIGGDELVLMAGPCSVEPGDVMLKSAIGVKAAGAKVLRGGAFKPRTSPYDFQGLGEEGLKLLAEARKETGLAIITEVMDTRDVELVYRYADIFQIGARNMQNFNLLKEVGKTDKPVVLKRGIAATIKEWFMCAEYILAQGNERVILCERGIRSYDPSTRNLFDATAVAIAKAETHLPVIVDPSHAAGTWQWVEPISRAAVAIGADGLIIESHPNPERALSDGAQSLRLEKLADVAKNLKPLAQAIGRSF